MKPVNWWYPAVIVVGAVAGFAVAGRSEPIFGDRDLTLETGATTTTVPAAGDGSSQDSVPATEAPPAPDISASRIVLAVPAGTPEETVADIVAALNAEGLASVTTSPARVEVTATQVRVAEGFDDAARVVLGVLGITADAVVLPEDAAATQTWSAADGDADVLVLLGPDVGA